MKVVKVETNEQLQDAFTIRKKVFVEEQHVPYELEIDEFEDDAAHFVIYDEDQPIGAGRFRFIDGNGKVERICILPAFRGTGAGKRMMNAIEDYAHASEINVLKLNAQTSAIPFYEKLGYHIVSDEFMDAGIPHKTMKKELE
ncbi:GNAT family N-acetyltransferase [Lederbergia citrea]|uniref:GNAT family N-acetyltransferase n=1 Tax=Lederbergia citrea TaxID=2833581 RepID=UPI001BC8DA02|nr:GNAT family N-acetyltransferase [Lederbergia citrea]MBS4177375.1 GNAT family N-acetyltransferase [Lederbergia citrea]